MRQMTPLKAWPALGGFDVSIGSCRLAEVTRFGLLSLAWPHDAEPEFRQALADASGIDLPPCGTIAADPGGDVRLLRMTVDHAYMLFESGAVERTHSIFSSLAQSIYVTELADALTVLRLQGDQTTDVLARICMLDLSGTSLTTGCVARTRFEHISVVVVHEAPSRFLLMCGRSYARSFQHDLEDRMSSVAALAH
ncbi:MAG: hypothetical protein AAF732_16270 [Pseudomonadota bacterium]